MLPEKLSKKDIEALKAFDPELAEAAQKMGHEYGNNMPQEEASWPRLQLLQGMSPAVTSGDHKSGGLLHSTSGHLYTESLAKKPIQFIPLFYFFSRVYLGDMDDGGGVNCSSPDGVHGQGSPGGLCAICPNSEWGENRRPPLCNAQHNYIVMIPDAPEEYQVAVLTGMKSNYVPLKEFNKTIRSLQGAPFLFEFTLSAVQANNEYKNWLYKFVPDSKTNRLEKSVMERSNWKDILPRAKELAEACSTQFSNNVAEAKSSVKSHDAPADFEKQTNAPLSEVDPSEIPFG